MRKVSHTSKIKPVRVVSRSVEQTIQFGTALARCLKKGDIVCLRGALGSGKTVLTKGIAQGLGIDRRTVNSPTFVLMNAYMGRLPLFHFDLYRITAAPELASIVYEEYFYDDGVCVIEWAERLGPLMPDNHLLIRLSARGKNTRVLTLTAKGARAQKIISRLP